MQALVCSHTRVGAYLSVSRSFRSESISIMNKLATRNSSCFFSLCVVVLDPPFIWSVHRHANGCSLTATHIAELSVGRKTDLLLALLLKIEVINNGALLLLK